ncbi:hypothetical protein UFOVP117_312 [uncultured Caudovirales phage]|uniref:Uncharacterized protein n=1 Tax=uncultured Caudovirales phage TaxID=2100421 RepID=A0A6J5L762_9CAUD|nr:hypothetical protein UFOVP117_312 [uncultured Caudovirales phage]
MENNKKELLERVLLLMKYNNKQTLSENYYNIYEQQIGYDSYLDRESNKENTTDRSGEYPNYCSSPDKAIMPPDNPAGASGEDALIPGFCYYRVTEKGGYFLPQDAKLEFWDDSSIYEAVDNWVKQYPKQDPEVTYQWVSEIVSPGAVSGFDWGGNHYQTMVRWTREGVNPDYDAKHGAENWKWNGFGVKNSSGGFNVYEPPKWEDRRGSFDRFTDEFGTMISLAISTATIIASMFLPIGPLLITAELLVELGLGIWIGQREFEKGNNVSAVFSVLFGMLPALKYSKYFRGVNPKSFTTLSRKMATEGLTSQSSPQKWARFYTSLDEGEQLVFSQALKMDDVTKGLMMKELKEFLSKQEFKNMSKHMSSLAKTDPSVLKDIPFLKRLWVRELGTGLATVGASFLTDGLLGDKLNDKQKQDFQWVYAHIPESLQKEMVMNMLYNITQSGEIMDNIVNDPKIIEIKSVIEKNVNVDFKSLTKKTDEYFARVLKDSVNNAGGTYIDIEDDNTKTIDPKQENLNKLQIKKMEKEGWVKETDLNIMDWPDNLDSTNVKNINGITYIKK